MKLKIFALILLLTIFGCTNDIPQVKISDNWVSQNVNQSDCKVRDGETYCQVTNPCVIGNKGSYEITQKMLDHCGECNNRTCKFHFESPEYEVKI